MQITQLLNQLTSVLEENKIEVNDNVPHPLGNEGHITVYPTTEEEIVNVLKFANETKKQITITGNGTKKGFGGIGERAPINLSLASYEGVLEHTPANMTVTVKSGTNFRKLQNYLKEHKQRIPLDPKLQESATIGGIIAANDSGPKRLAYGSARDCVIGLKMIYPDGSIIRCGGKVVKNVAGYDMNKLFIGSMGTLGVISEVTMKLRPVPKEERAVFLSFHNSEVEEIRSFVVGLLHSHLEPVTLELLTPSFAEKLIGRKSYTLVISFEDVSRAIQYEEDYVKKLAKSKHISLTVWEGEELQRFWKDFDCSRPNGAAETIENEAETNAVIKIGVKNLEVITILKEAEKQASTHSIDVDGHGGLGHGLCELSIKGKSKNVLSVITELRKVAEQLGGYGVVMHLPLSLRKQISVWGEKPEHFFLLAGIKKRIDRNKTLNVGRYVGGI